MLPPKNLVPTLYAGWAAFQESLTKALNPLGEAQLALRAAPHLRSVDQIARHIIGARARWFYMLFEEGGPAFKTLGGWDRPDAPARSSAELQQGLGETWTGMQTAIASWTAEAWQQTWAGEDESEPDMITRPWVIWHLIEHDLYHGGEISLTLGIHHLPAIGL